MKKAGLLLLVCWLFPLFTLGVCDDPFCVNINPLKDTVKPVLRVKGARVYNENIRLEKSDVLSIMNTVPAAAGKFEKGTNLRGTGGLLIVGGSALLAGGVALAISGIETNTSDGYYYDYTYTDFTRNYYIGLIIATLGELMLDGGIACSIVGKMTIKKAVRDFNYSARQSGLTPEILKYQFGLLDDGKFGMKITF